MKQTEHKTGENRHSEGQPARERPHQWRAGQPQPAGHKQRKQRRRQQTAAQVVQDFPAADDREIIRDRAFVNRGDPRQEPGQQLPVSANPAARATQMNKVMRRIVFVQDDVGYQPDAPVNPFDQIVTE